MPPPGVHGYLCVNGRHCRVVASLVVPQKIRLLFLSLSSFNCQVTTLPVRTQALIYDTCAPDSPNGLIDACAGGNITDGPSSRRNRNPSACAARTRQRRGELHDSKSSMLAKAGGKVAEIRANRFLQALECTASRWSASAPSARPLGG